MTPILIDRKAAAAALGVSLWTLDQWIAAGELPIVRLPSSKRPGEKSRRVLVSTDDLKAFAEKHREGAA